MLSPYHQPQHQPARSEASDTSNLNPTESASEPATALIAGINGTVGRSLSRTLSDAGWRVVGISRRPSLLEHTASVLALELMDPEACDAAGAMLAGVTHLFYAARASLADPHEDERVNVQMFENILTAVERHAPGLRHVQLVHGTKWYGSHLGPYRTPAREDDPRHFPPNFYYGQQDLAATRSAGRGWRWSAVRPHTVWGITLGSPHNFALLLGAYAAICRQLGLPLIFPGTQGGYDSISQATDAAFLARAMLWVSETPSLAGLPVNLVNADFFRWRYLWPDIAAFFGMTAGPVQPMRMAEAMAGKQPVWDSIVTAHRLRPTAFADLGSWGFFDFILRADQDDLSDTSRIRQAGWAEVVETKPALFALFRQLQAERLLPG